MSTLSKPKFKKLNYSTFGGAPLLLSLWNHFDFSILLTQCGIYKGKGCPTWKLAFLFVIGLMARCSSCLQMVRFYEGESLLQRMFDMQTVTQSVFSRFLVSSFAWETFNIKRVARFQEQEETRLVDDDVIALDDTLIEHNHARKMPFLYRLWDHCSKTYVNALNVVVLQAVKANGLQYPLLYEIWKQDNGQESHETKLDLALRMLKKVKEQAGKLRCWVAMDSWYFVKGLYLAIEELEYHWVTRAKKNTTLYRKVMIRGRERMIKILPERLYREAKPVFSFWRQKGTRCMRFKDIYIAVDEIHHGKGKRKEPVLKPVNAVVTAYLEEDEDNGRFKEIFALLLSNRVDEKPETIVGVYKKRWSIEIFFRNAKQELGLNECHSTEKHHIHAHLSLLMVAESLVRFAQWKYNEKTDKEEVVTHGQVVAHLFHIRCEVQAKSKDSIQIYFDMASQRFARFFQKYWPEHLFMDWFAPKAYWDSYPASG